jgi:hypothetical protein
MGGLDGAGVGGVTGRNPAAIGVTGSTFLLERFSCYNSMIEARGGVPERANRFSSEE